MLIWITDTRHKDYDSIIGRWRMVDATHIEYRDGGIWSRLHISQYRLVNNF